MSTNYYNLGLEPNIKIQENVNGSIDVEKENFRRIMKNNMENKAIFLIEFSNVNKEGDLSIYHNGWRIIMPNKECITLGDGKKGYNPQRRYFKIENQYHVIVTSIDEENSIIYVSHAQATRILRKTLATKIRNELKKQRKEKKSKIILPARIVAVDDDQEYIALDIAGFGISGIINRNNLRVGHSQKLSDVYKVRSEIDVCVYRISQLPNGMNVFLCRENSLNIGDAWKGISDRISSGDLVIVKCVKLNNGSFVGSIEGERVSVLCIYPRYRRQKRTEEIQVGQYYRAVVVEMDEKKHSLICKVLSNAQKEQLSNKESGLTESIENAYIAINATPKNDENNFNKKIVEDIMQNEKHNKNENISLEEDNSSSETKM